MTDLVSNVQRQLKAVSSPAGAARLLVAVSGGADSMVLLDILRQLSTDSRLKLEVAHFNHKLRGKSSDSDQRLVARYCKLHGIPFHFDRWEIEDRGVKIGKMGVEAAAREARLAFLGRIARKRRIRWVATAHHADDQCESFFLRLFRGAGGEGLSGMCSVDPFPGDPKLNLLRPLLESPASAVREFAALHRVHFREDESNRDVRFERNWIRHQLLPLIIRRQGNQVQSRIVRAMDLICADADLAGGMAENWMASKPGARGRFEDQHVAIQRCIVLEQLIGQGVHPGFDLIESLRLHRGHPVTVAPGRVLRRDSEGMLIQVSEPDLDHNTAFTEIRIHDGEGSVAVGKRLLNWRCDGASRGNAKLPHRRAGWEWFDRDIIGDTWLLRNWLPGDRFQPIGLPKPAKLQDLFVNAKIPATTRRSLGVAVTARGEIFWVEGLRIGELAKVRAETRRLLGFALKQTQGTVQDTSVATSREAC